MNDILKKEIDKFAKSFNNLSIDKELLQFGSFFMKAKVFDDPSLVNFSGFDFLNFRQQYEIVIDRRIVRFYIQLYENVTGAGVRHYRLASYSQVANQSGMIFTINLNKYRGSDGNLFLTSKYSFNQRPGGIKELTDAHRKLKQFLFSEILDNLGFDLTDNNEILFGIFDTKKNSFINTTPTKFLHDFLLISILKGHFMSNKGYRIELLPNLKEINPELKSFENNADMALPSILVRQRAKRSIPLGLRYKVLCRDKSTCSKCGRTPSDGIKLHIDHIIPFSRLGITTLNNLRVLCNECNIGRSNLYED